MRVVLDRILGATLPVLLVFGAVGLTASTARAGFFTAPQCPNQGDVLDYYGATSDFSGLGLSTSKCKSLCKKNGSECRSFVNKAKGCNNKAINSQTATSKKAFCSTLSGSDKKDCKQFYNDEGKDQKSSVKSGTSAAISICDEIKDDCLALCEAPLE